MSEPVSVPVVVDTKICELCKQPIKVKKQLKPREPKQQKPKEPKEPKAEKPKPQKKAKKEDVVPVVKKD